jgi:hypothetical protein
VEKRGSAAIRSTSLIQLYSQKNVLDCFISSHLYPKPLKKRVQMTEKRQFHQPPTLPSFLIPHSTHGPPEHLHLSTNPRQPKHLRHPHLCINSQQRSHLPVYLTNPLPPPLLGNSSSVEKPPQQAVKLQSQIRREKGACLHHKPSRKTLCRVLRGLPFSLCPRGFCRREVDRGGLFA